MARSDPHPLPARGLERGISAARLRQRMDAFATCYTRALNGANQALLERVQMAVTPLCTGHVGLDRDLFAPENSGTRKKGAVYSYRSFDGHGVMSA